VYRYDNLFKSSIIFLIALQVAFYFFGQLRPSIIYDYLDFFPFTIFPIVIYIYFLRKNIQSTFSRVLSIYIATILILFPIGHLFKINWLTTYTINPSYENLDLQDTENYIVSIDIDGSVILDTFEGEGYKVDIINKPGEIGYPETIETLIGDPRALIFREIDTDRLFQIKGWDLQLGNNNLWKLDLISFDSEISLDNITLSSSEIVGTGEIYLGPNLNAKEIKLNGNYKVIVSNELPIVVIGDAVVPTNWINATIGYLNQIESNYELQVKIENGSEVEFINEN
jgi:hypothetical protein